MGKIKEGSTAQLITFCAWYFILYVIYTLALKYFTGPAKVADMEYLVYNTIGGSTVCLAIIFIYRWYRLKSNRMMQIGKWQFPSEIYYIIPSGICTAVVIPTTTLMYLLLPSVMIAQVIMRGSIIVVNRLIDAIQIKQGILHKKVYWQEEIAVLFAIVAVSFQVFYGKKTDQSDLIHSPAAMIVLVGYLVAYFIRLYIMNYYKNTRGKGVPQDNKGFFAIEQFAASGTILIVGLVLFYFVQSNAKPIFLYHQAFFAPKTYTLASGSTSYYWPWEIVSGFPYGILAFFSVFLFMFKGRTATFAGLSNRLTSLLAGTAATLLFCVTCGGRTPKTEDWISLFFILVAVGFLAFAEKRRIAELKALKELA